MREGISKGNRSGLSLIKAGCFLKIIINIAVNCIATFHLKRNKPLLSFKESMMKAICIKDNNRLVLEKNLERGLWISIHRFLV